MHTCAPNYFIPIESSWRSDRKVLKELFTKALFRVNAVDNSRVGVQPSNTIMSCGPMVDKQAQGTNHLWETSEVPPS